MGGRPAEPVQTFRPTSLHSDSWLRPPWCRWGSQASSRPSPPAPLSLGSAGWTPPHLRQPVALKKTSGSTGSRGRLLLPSHQPEKGMMTRSASTGSASAISSSFSSSVEDRFQSSPGGPRAQQDQGTGPPRWTPPLLDPASAEPRPAGPRPRWTPAPRLPLGLPTPDPTFQPDSRVSRAERWGFSVRVNVTHGG